MIAGVKRVVSHFLAFRFSPNTWDKVVMKAFSWNIVEHATCILFVYKLV